MHFFTALTAAISMVSVASAAHVEKNFYLKTKLVKGQTNTAFNDLYVQLYHVGAGFNAAVLTPESPGKIHSYINGTSGEVMFVIPAEKPYEGRLLFLEPYDTESGWAPTQVNTVVAGTKGFSLTSEGYLVNKHTSSQFGGWRVCDWNHGVPELFHDIKGFNDGVPSSCALVDLVASFIK